MLAADADLLIEEADAPVIRGGVGQQRQARRLQILLGSLAGPLGGVALARQFAPQIDFIARRERRAAGFIPCGGLRQRAIDVAVQRGVDVGRGADADAFSLEARAVDAQHGDGQIVVAGHHLMQPAVELGIVEIAPVERRRRGVFGGVLPARRVVDLWRPVVAFQGAAAAGGE